MLRLFAMIKKPKKSRGTWERNPVTKVKESSKEYKGSKAKDLPDDYDLDDLVEEITDTMEDQEKKDPNLKQVHARLSPEWHAISHKVAKWLMCEEPEKRDHLREEIIGEGEIGIRVLTDLLLSLKPRKPQ